MNSPISTNQSQQESTPRHVIRAMMAERAYDASNMPPKPIPVLMLGGKVISTPGNLTNIQSPPKTGKSSVAGAIIVSMWNVNHSVADTLGFSADNVDQMAVIHIDTEQSRYDHGMLLRRASKRAVVEAPPRWFYSYCLTDVSISNRKQIIEVAMQDAETKHGGVFAVIIDGVADLCASPNDEKESFALIDWLQKSAITYECAIITVLHENPSNGGWEAKTRGHLGSQLERKAETLIRLAKDAKGITTIWSERCRHNHIPKSEGLCFAWSDEAGMHVSVGKAPEIKATADRHRMKDEANKAFGDSESMRHTELKKAVMKKSDVVETTAKNWIKRWLAKEVVSQNAAGHYLLSKV